MSFLVIPVFVMLLRGALTVLILAGAESLCSDVLSARVRRALWILCIFLMLLPQMNFPFQPFAIDMSGFRAGLISAALALPRELTSLVTSTEIGVALAEYSSAIPGLTHYNYPYIFGLIIAVVPALFLLLSSYLRCRKRTAKYKKVTDERLLRIWQQVVGDAGRRPLLLDSGATGHPPVLFGFFRQKLLLPVEYMARFSDSELELLLTHEYIHYRSGDGIINILTLCMWPFGWYNPFFLAARRKLRIACELACDAEVLKRFPDRISEYGKLLLSFADTDKAPEVVIPFREYSGELRSRIVYIVELPQRRKSSVFLAFLLAGILAAPFGLVAAIDRRPGADVIKEPIGLTLLLSCGGETVQHQIKALPCSLQIDTQKNSALTAVENADGVLLVKTSPGKTGRLRMVLNGLPASLRVQAVDTAGGMLILPENDNSLLLPAGGSSPAVFKIEAVRKYGPPMDQF